MVSVANVVGDKLKNFKKERVTVEGILAGYKNAPDKSRYLDNIANKIKSSTMEKSLDVIDVVTIIFDLADFTETKVYLEEELSKRIDTKNFKQEYGATHTNDSYALKEIFRKLWHYEIAELINSIDYYFGEILDFYIEENIPHLVRFVGDGFLLVFPIKIYSLLDNKTTDCPEIYKQKVGKYLNSEFFFQSKNLLTEHSMSNLKFLNEKKNGNLSNYRELNCTIYRGHTCTLLSIPQFNSQKEINDLDVDVISEVNKLKRNNTRLSNEYEFAGSSLDFCFRINKISGGYYVACNKEFHDVLETEKKINGKGKGKSKGKVISEKDFLEEICYVKSSQLKGLDNSIIGDKMELRIAIIEGCERFFEDRIQMIEDSKLLTSKVEIMLLKKNGR